MPQPKPQFEDIPTEDAGYQKYHAAAKLRGKRAIITGGDSGIGRATAVLFAMEGASSLIAYLPEEEKDAKDTKAKVEKYGQKCHLMAVDLTSRENCKKVVDEALSKMGGIDILFNNHGYQMMTQSILDLSEYVRLQYPLGIKLEIIANEVPGTNGSEHSTPTSTLFSTFPNMPCRTWASAAPSSTTPA